MADDRRLYELINPSDPITFWATPLEAAVIADRMGAAMYFVKDVETGEAPPERSDLKDAYEALWKYAAAIASYAQALASFLVGPAADRFLFDEIVAGMSAEGRLARRAKWHDERRSSLNDICSKCWEAAERVAAYEPEAA